MGKTDGRGKATLQEVPWLQWAPPLCSEAVSSSSSHSSLLQLFCPWPCHPGAVLCPCLPSGLWLPLLSPPAGQPSKVLCKVWSFLLSGGAAQREAAAAAPLRPPPRAPSPGWALPACLQEGLGGVGGCVPAHRMRIQFLQGYLAGMCTQDLGLLV